MADGETSNPFINDECPICTELLKNPRVLKCKHVLCLECLEKVEHQRVVKCPLCTAESHIPPGMGVRHLPKHVAGARRGGLELVTSWHVESYCDLTVDEDAQVIYLGTYKREKPVMMYSYTGESLGHIAGGQGIALSRITMDTRRGLVVISGRDAQAHCDELLLYDNMGTMVGRIKHAKFKCLGRVCYHRNMDRYLVTDTDAHAIFMIDPETSNVTKAIRNQACRTLKSSSGAVTQNALVCGSGVKRVATWALNDEERSMVHLYDREGCLVRTYGSAGAGYRQFHNVWGMCMDGEGRVLVCDSQNHRLVRLSPEGASNRQEWQVLFNTADHGLKSPSYVYVTQDKLLMLVAMKPDGKGCISIFSGYV